MYDYQSQYYTNKHTCLFYKRQNCSTFFELLTCTSENCGREVRWENAGYWVRFSFHDLRAEKKSNY